MDNYDVKLRLRQKIEDEEELHVFIGQSCYIGEGFDTLAITAKEDEGSIFTFHVYFLDDESLTIKTSSDGYRSFINLKHNEMTKGKCIVKNADIEFQFLLRKIIKKSLDIYVEYDIFTNGNLMSKNVIEIEVQENVD